MVEEQCVAQARGGDASAFEELVRTYEAPVYRLALRMCGGRAEDAQEVAQEAFLAAWRGLPRFRGQCRFSSWLYKLTANAAVDHLRREKRRPAAVPLENAGEPADPHTPQEELERRELHRAVQQALDRLTPEHREVLLLAAGATLALPQAVPEPPSFYREYPELVSSEDQTLVFTFDTKGTDVFEEETRKETEMRYRQLPGESVPVVEDAGLCRRTAAALARQGIAPDHRGVYRLTPRQMETLYIQAPELALVHMGSVFLLDSLG